jgi:NmrA-like family
MPNKKLLVVVGASGVQGTSVIRGVLTSPSLSSQFSIRGISRDTVAAAAKTHLRDSITWSKANINDSNSLIKAFEGAHTVFGVTDFWQVLNAEGEAEMGKRIVEAAKTAGVKHLIWSTQLSASKISNGKYPHAEHLDGKYAVSQYLEQTKGDMASTHLCLPVYMSNFARLLAYPSPVDGVREWKSCWDANTTKVAFVDSAIDTGLFVGAIMHQFSHNPSSVNGKFFHAVSQFLSPHELVTTFKAVRGEELRYEELSVEQFRAILPPILSDLADQWSMMREFGLFGKDEQEVQAEHDKILEGVGEKSSWEKYVARDWDQDVANPMIVSAT